MNEEVAIKVENVSKTFKLPHEKTTSIKSAFINFYKRNKTYEKQQALEDISFEVKKGEFFGIVGRNGGGKSTLLKLLAGIYTPSKGSITLNGKLTPFIELGVGFNQELSGRENVFLNGALLGFNRKEMDAMYDDIVEFAEIERFMDQKLKNYSSGMQVRLAFSIATRTNSDILLIDEVLAVGDASFQQKCFEYFEYLKDKKATIILVSHDMGAVMRFCTRALLIEDGKIKNIGDPDEVAGQYTLDNIATIEEGSGGAAQGIRNKSLSGPVSSLSVKQNSPVKLTRDGTLNFEVTYSLSKDVEVDLGYGVISNGFPVAEQNTKALTLPGAQGKKHTVACSIPLEYFNPGSYTVDVAIFTKQGFKLIGYQIGSIKFVIQGFDKFRGGPIRTNGEWRIHDKEDS